MIRITMMVHVVDIASAAVGEKPVQGLRCSPLARSSWEGWGLFCCLGLYKSQSMGPPCNHSSAEATKSHSMVVLTTNHPTQSNRTPHDDGPKRGGGGGGLQGRRGCNHHRIKSLKKILEK